MKKVFFCLIALVAFSFVSCNKEQEVSEDLSPNVSEELNDKQDPEEFVISAYFDDGIEDDVDVKTVYTEESIYFSFEWRENDIISVQLYTGGDSSNPNQIKFKAKSDGAESEFRQDGSTFDLTTTHDVEGYSNKSFTLGDYAFYPKEGNGVNTWALTYSHSNKTVALSNNVDYIDANPTSIIPLIGKKQSGDGTPDAQYGFRTATGAIKLHINNIPLSATKIVLTSKNTGDVLSGTWDFNNETANTVYTDGLEMATVKSSSSYSKTINLTSLSSQNKDFYIPIPVGTIHGFTLQIYSGSTLQYTKSTSKDIEISRAQVTVLPEFTVAEWVPFGIAKFKDVKVFSEESYDSFVNVVIEESTSTPGKYRLDNPYGALYTALSKEPAKTPTRYLEFKVVEKGQSVKWEWNNNPSFTASTSNEVAFNYSIAGTENNGKTYTGHSTTSCFVHPGWTTSGETDLVKTNNHVRNRVIAYQNSGYPALVRICPKYRNDEDSAWLTCEDSRAILIVFPGCDNYVGIDKITIPSAESITVTSDNTDWGSGKSALIDTNISTFWHSNDALDTKDHDNAYGCYIDINLDSGSANSFVINCLMRTDKGDTNGMPQKVEIYGKTTAEGEWAKLDEKTYSTSQLGAGFWLDLPLITGATEYKLIRVAVIKSYYNGTAYHLKEMYTHMAELELYGK